ncbi:MAG: hypothetical protein KAT04_01390 [Methylococcales bacterium]|nr:hypothetical protein [Methylococcales bacterium]
MGCGFQAACFNCGFVREAELLFLTAIAANGIEIRDLFLTNRTGNKTTSHLNPHPPQLLWA